MQIGLGLSPTIPMGVAAPAFSPASIAGLQLWLDASDSSTLFQNSNGTTPATADGDPVGYWGDKSGNGRNGTQADGTKKLVLTKTITQNGKNGVIGDGVNDCLVTAGTSYLFQPHTYFIVVKTFFLNKLIDRIIDGLNDAGNIGGWEGGKWVLYSGTPSFAGTRTTDTTLVSVKFDGSNTNLRTNGSLNFGPVNVGSNNPTVISLLGNNNNSSGYAALYEVLAYNSISDVNRDKIELYLNDKWSIY